jgi:hypothetical protein
MKLLTFGGLLWSMDGRPCSRAFAETRAERCLDKSTHALAAVYANTRAPRKACPPEVHFTEPIEAELTELLLGGEALGVGFEVAAQVRPADLARAQGQMAMGPPAV